MAGEDARPPRKPAIRSRSVQGAAETMATASDTVGSGTARGPAASPYSFKDRVVLAIRRNGAGYLFLSPWLIGFFGLTLIPTLASLYLSFTNYDLLTPPRWAGASNYDYAFFADERFGTALSVTFRYVIWSVPLKLLVALALALVLDKGVR